MTIKSELIDICKLVSDKGFVAATDGNISVRIAKNRILCTPSALPKGKTKENDLITVDLEGKILEGNRKPSTEIKMHLEIYKKRVDINAVVHCHPCYATGFASSNMKLDMCIFPEIILTLGAVPICDYATPSTDEVVNSISGFINQTDVLLLKNHGAVTYGKDLYQAYYKMEKLEHSAKTLFIAKMLGQENILSKCDVDKLYDVNEKTYKIDLSHKLKCKTQNEQIKNMDNDTIKKIIKETILESEGVKN